METTKMLTSLLVLTLTGPTLGYPYTRGVLPRASERARDRQLMDSSLSDYLEGYVQDQQYGLPEYQPAYRHEYATPQQRPRINAETLAALLPYMINNNDDYAYDYNSYSDNDGTWYDDAASDDIDDSSDSDNAALLQFLWDHRNGRYSLEDLETLEREAEMEDNTENQLHALMAKKNIKKSHIPQMGVRTLSQNDEAPIYGRQGQKEEALDIPPTSFRQPIFAQRITTQPDENEVQKKWTSVEGNVVATAPQKKDNADNTQQSSSDVVKASPATTDDAAGVPVVPSTSQDSTAQQQQQPMTPYMQSKYDALINYLDRERKVRQNQDIEQELQQETKSQPQKRFVSEQDVLSQQLVNLKKKVA